MDGLSDSSKNVFEDSRNPHLRELGNPGQEDLADYSQDRIFIGWNIGGQDEYQNLIRRFLQQDYDTGEAVNAALRKFKDVVGDRRERVFFDRSSANLVFVGGARGSGKTFNLRGLSNRSTMAGVNNILIDPEGEYYTNNLYNGIQKELMNLRSEESRQNVKTKVLTPYFVHAARREQDLPLHGRGEDWHDVFKFEFSDLTPNDLEFMFTSKFNDHPDWTNFTSQLNDRLDRITSWQDVIDIAHELQEDGEFDYNSRANQIETFITRNYKSWKFLGSDQKIDLGSIFDEYNAVALNLHDDDYLPSDLKMKELYVAFLIKRVRNLVQTGEISAPLNLLVDEAHRYIPAYTDPEKPPSKAEVRKIIKTGRHQGFRVTMASQEPSDVQEKNFLNQTRYFLIPQNMKPRPRKLLLKKAGIHGGTRDRGRNKWTKITRGLDEYEWLIADAAEQWWCCLEPASPLANHRQEQSG